MAGRGALPDEACLSRGWTAVVDVPPDPAEAARHIVPEMDLWALTVAARRVVAVARARGSFDRANHRLAVTDARQPVAERPAGI